MRILVVEDHRDTANVLERALRQQGYEVESVNTGGGAVLACGDHTFDVLIADIGLPDCDGWELLQRIKGKTKRAIACSGYAMDSDIERSKEAGFDAHLAKPVGLAELIQEIEFLLRDVAQEKGPVG